MEKIRKHAQRLCDQIVMVKSLSYTVKATGDKVTVFVPKLLKRPTHVSNVKLG